MALGVALGVAAIAGDEETGALEYLLAKPVTSPGATAADIFNGTVSSFAVAMGIAGMAFLLGGVTGRKGIARGGASVRDRRLRSVHPVQHDRESQGAHLVLALALVCRRRDVDLRVDLERRTAVHRRGDGAPR